MSAMTLAEWHTSDIGEPCLRKLYLKHQGKIDAQMTRALFRGFVAQDAIAWIHQSDAWGDVKGAVQAGQAQTRQRAEDEHRPLSPSVHNNESEIIKEVEKHVQHYVERRRDYFAKCKLIGVEIPVRWSQQEEGMEPIEWASHIDLAYRDEYGQLVIEDWKWHKDSPTMAYLGRNLQFALYHMTALYGQWRLADGYWPTMGELAHVAWCDLAGFKPYARKTVNHGVTYQNGDARPIDSLVKRWQFSDDREPDIRRALAERVCLLRAGFYPVFPDKLGCQLCECQQWCVPFHKDNQPEL